MKILSTSSWLPSCTDNNVIMYCLPSGHHDLNLINWTAWSSCDMCIKWKEPWASCLQLYKQHSVLAAMACSNLISWTMWLSFDVCVNWNEPQVSRLQLYEQPGAVNDAGVWAGGCKWSLPRYPKGQSRTCYQECGCHLLVKQWWNLTIRRKGLWRFWPHSLCTVSNV